MPSTTRQRRIADQIQAEISALLLKGLKDPRLGFVTITGVELSPDLKHAKVFCCTPEGEAAKDELLAGLRSAAGFIRKSLSQRMRLRSVPELEFRWDASIDHGAHISALLDEVRQKEGWDDPTRVRGSAEEVARELLAAKRVLVTSHLNPDGDAVASILALGLALRALGKDVVVYNPDPVPDNFRFLPGSADVRTAFEPGAYDVTAVLDCSELGRVGPLPAPAERGKLVSLDHHLTTQPLGEAYYVNPGASAIGEMIHALLPHLGVEADADIATNVYTSILADTGSFHYSNATPAALRVAADMVERGVKTWDVALAVYESQPLCRLRLLGRVLETLEVPAPGQHGSILVTQQMFQETGTTKDMLDGFINYPRSIEGVEVAIQFREENPARYKVSFRSRGRVNVAEIAERFGGGGHFNAAGCTLDGPLPEVRALVFAAVEEALAE
ncbi:MAG TPA: 30S ribosome-binding factor RbfA [Myxococcota bacterium]|nr:30S ribosome-binding factor RbfA [Myxococcota bacterium]HRY92317.1 30S ribosome-binding factor RbfA [Myxococcota bacterium]HSA23242.1 30S ribosome-binding factor RbfA [Myxococcota bacterium]